MNEYAWIQMTRAGGAVKRCHTIRTLTENSIASHSFGVVMFVLALTKGKASANLLKAALYHDLAEQETGDIPATAKWSHPELSKILKDIEHEFDKRWGLDINLHPYDLWFLKSADMLDFVYYMAEEIKLGNEHAKEPFYRGVDYLLSMNVEHNDVGKCLLDNVLRSLV